MQKPQMLFCTACPTNMENFLCVAFAFLAFKACGVLVSQTDTTAGTSISAVTVVIDEVSGEARRTAGRRSQHQTLDMPWEYEGRGRVQRATSHSSGQDLNVRGWEKK